MDSLKLRENIYFVMTISKFWSSQLYHVRALSKFAFAVPPFPLAVPGSSFDVADSLTLSLVYESVNLLKLTGRMLKTASVRLYTLPPAQTKNIVILVISLSCAICDV